MSTHELHPDVQKFKEFVDDHPKVKEQLRKNHKLIQSYYEKWMILGEDDPFWSSLTNDKKRSSPDKADWFKQLGDLVEEIDWEEVSKHIEELNGALGQFQQIISDVKRNKEEQSRPMEYPYF